MKNHNCDKERPIERAIIIFGVVGCGKSTTVNYLIGKTLTLVERDDNDFL